MLKTRSFLRKAERNEKNKSGKWKHTRFVNKLRRKDPAKIKKYETSMTNV
ncbi:MAG: hypothetical protein LBQ31_05720 [Bacteroidales bacterium]|jgi:hypothetical protein|nr:hypothetical protein [Bacteroidales bacterium]